MGGDRYGPVATGPFPAYPGHRRRIALGSGPVRRIATICHTLAGVGNPRFPRTIPATVPSDATHRARAQTPHRRRQASSNLGFRTAPIGDNRPHRTGLPARCRHHWPRGRIPRRKTGRAWFGDQPPAATPTAFSERVLIRCCILYLDIFPCTSASLVSDALFLIPPAYWAFVQKSFGSS